MDAAFADAYGHKSIFPFSMTAIFKDLYFGGKFEHLVLDSICSV